MRKKVDSRIQILIDNCIKQRQRGFFIIVGDRGREQIANLHYLLTKSNWVGNQRVLWCYKKELEFSSHKRKRIKQIDALKKKGLYDADLEDPFELFISSAQIRYCYYKETHKILGQTNSLLILQDFEALNPNILCRTIETVQGGGFVILLLKTMTSLKQLYTVTMDIHQRFRTGGFQDIEPRFNERFILSLSQCNNCIVMDDELNILPISSSINQIQQLIVEETLEYKATKELGDLVENFKKQQPESVVTSLIKLAKTLDQAKSIMLLYDALTDKALRYTISLTAARGRGKSATIGLCVAGAIALGFSNIFVTAPSPENLQAFFEFLIQGLEALNYKENQHYDIIQSTNPDFENAIIRVNVYKSHRQIVQYIMPTDYQQIGQADLLVIDEAAAIPLIYVKRLLGPYLVFLSSTVNGYEGTGRSLSLKLIQQLRDQNKFTVGQQKNQSSSGGRMLKEVTLADPIRYAANDPIEKWLNELLLLEATSPPQITGNLPHPNDCELYLVNRDTLFSYKKVTEKFLFNLMSLFISSHYKNSPNDLLLLADAPAHAIFVLFGSINQNEKKQELPDILCAIQVAFEGQITKQMLSQVQERSFKPSGDLIPWIISEQYQDKDFPQLSGARVVRIATHPAAQKMGYGSKALELLEKFFEGQLINVVNENIIQEDLFSNNNFSSQQIDKTDQQNLENKEIKKKVVKPILKRLCEIKPPQMNYLGVSYGLTKELFRFWRKNKYQTLYIRQSKNEITAEHTCLMLKPLQVNEQLNSEKSSSWLQSYSNDFKKRFLNLLSFEFKDLDLQVCLEMINHNFDKEDQKQLTDKIEHDEIEGEKENKQLEEIRLEYLEEILNLYDFKRLEAYTKNLVDFHLILDLLPNLAKIFFLNKLPQMRLSYMQSIIIMGLGLQHKTVEKLEQEINYPVSQILALFNKAMKKFYNNFQRIYQEKINKTLPINQISEQQQKNNLMIPVKANLLDEMLEEGVKVKNQLNKKINQDKKDDLNQKRKNKYNFELDDITDNQIQQAVEKTQNNKNKNIIIERAQNNQQNSQFENINLKPKVNMPYKKKKFK